MKFLLKREELDKILIEANFGLVSLPENTKALFAPEMILEGEPIQSEYKRVLAELEELGNMITEATKQKPQKIDEGKTNGSFRKEWCKNCGAMSIHTCSSV